jgi:hypothetical protein
MQRRQHFGPHCAAVGAGGRGLVGISYGGVFILPAVNIPGAGRAGAEHRHREHKSDHCNQFTGTAVAACYVLGGKSGRLS